MLFLLVGWWATSKVTIVVRISAFDIPQLDPSLAQMWSHSGAKWMERDLGYIMSILASGEAEEAR